MEPNLADLQWTEICSPALQHAAVKPELGTAVAGGNQEHQDLTAASRLPSVCDMKMPPAQGPLHCCPLAACNSLPILLDVGCC